jgi:high-affinity iron transporter
MFGTGLIVFRETLEAALFVGIVAASTAGLLNRTRWLSLGVAVGVLGSLLMASAMGHLSAWADGIGQDIVTAAILSVALLMLAWHCVFVSTRSYVMVQDAKRLGASTVQGKQTLWALAIAVALSVLREGAETVLFVAGLMSGANESPGTLFFSVVLGLGLGVFAGWLMYTGLGRVKPQRLFGITNTLMLMLAGSLASQLAKTANQANWITQFGEPVWDISSLLPNDSVLGMVLHGVLGFDASPALLQLLFYLATTLLIFAATRQMKISSVQRQRQTPLQMPMPMPFKIK